MDAPEPLSAAAWKERVQACFEALRVRGIPLTVETLDGVQMDARIESVDDAKGRMVLSIPRAPSGGLGADDEVRLFLTLQDARWMGRARVHYHNDRRTRFTLVLPARLEPRDRRRQTRVLLDTTENVKAVFVPADARFLEVVGRLSNLSESGFRLAVESARDMVRDRPVDPGDVPLEEHELLESVRITGLRAEPLEAEGVVLEVDPQPLGPILGVRFRSLPRAEQDFLGRFIHARVQAPQPALPAPPPPLDEPPPLPAEEAAEEEPEAPANLDQRLKRFRTLALVMPPGHERDALHGFLAAQGFTRVLPAGTLAELAALTRKSPPDVFLVDWPETPAAELDIVLFLGNHPFPSPPRILLACRHATTQLAREANRLGVSHLLVKPYPLDGALVALLLQHLGSE